MTDGDPSRGLNEKSWTGIAHNSVAQPRHIGTVIARLDHDKSLRHSRKSSRCTTSPTTPWNWPTSMNSAYSQQRATLAMLPQEQCV